MKIVIGNTGFVGSNLYSTGAYDKGFHSTDIQEAYGLKPKLCVYAGLRAEKYLANTAPEKDYALIREAWENIQQIAPQKLVLISTVDVFKNPNGKDENSLVDTENLHPYGANRYVLEQLVREKYPEALIIRLPGLYGKNIKKNFLYDCIRRIPFMLKAEKITELAQKEPALWQYYEESGNGFYKVKALSLQEEAHLKELLKVLGFSAIQFTDSRSSYQFYPLSRLQQDIETCLERGITLWHPATEPVSASSVYEYVYGEPFVNELTATPVNYDFRTVYGEVFGTSNGYICDKEFILKDIKQFIEEATK